MVGNIWSPPGTVTLRTKAVASHTHNTTAAMDQNHIDRSMAA
jgi:hypothetical protein